MAAFQQPTSERTIMNIYERDTPRTDAEHARLLELDYGGDVTNAWEVAFLLLRDFAKRLEQELETCRDAHMANCLAADTLRREIRELREDRSNARCHKQ
jgi:hypothetical protein